MNVDRFALSSHRYPEQGMKFTRPTSNELQTSLHDYLDTVTRASDFCYKDVVQPFVVSSWLQHKRSINSEDRPNLLRIEADIAFVACRMIELNWLYPMIAAPVQRSVLYRMTYGLVMAQRAMRLTEGEAVAFEDLILGPIALSTALHRLYPDLGASVRDVVQEVFDKGGDDSSYARIRRTRSYREAAVIVESLV